MKVVDCNDECPISFLRASSESAFELLSGRITGKNAERKKNKKAIRRMKKTPKQSET
jgi:hypothetical protein